MRANAATPASLRGAVPLLLATVLAGVLLLGGYRTFKELDRQRLVLLQSRAASLALRIESMPAPPDNAAVLEALLDEDPGLVDVAVLRRSTGDGLDGLWDGRELYRAGFISGETFRAYVPVHAPEGLRIARLDLAVASAEFLTHAAKRNLVISVLVAITLVALTWFGQRMARQRAVLERNRLEMEHLAQLGRMSGVLAHEIRNPLGAMKGFLQLAQERNSLALLDPALQQISRLESLVRDLLLYGRPPMPSPAETRWSEIETRLAAQVGAAGDTLLAASPSDFTFRTDAALLEQALTNLIRNAVEAGGPVELSARAGSGVEIRVADRGPGLSPEIRQRLFEPYLTTKASGTGLGLVIAKRLVEALHGRLTLEDREGGGTVALLRFPAG